MNSHRTEPVILSLGSSAAHQSSKNIVCTYFFESFMNVVNKEFLISTIRAHFYLAHFPYLHFISFAAVTIPVKDKKNILLSL